MGSTPVRRKCFPRDPAERFAEAARPDVDFSLLPPSLKSSMKLTRLLLLAGCIAGATLAFGEPAGTHVKAAAPARIAMGEKVELADYLVPGKTTIFDFTSQFCPPCRAIAPFVEKLHTSRDDLAVVSVDINRPGIKGIDWQSPVARQYGMQSIPYFKVYGPTGELLAEGDKARSMVTAWFK